MKTMLDKCAVAGDITQAIDRRGAWSCAITVIGGTESTAVKLQSCETADGTFEDFKTLIPSAEASASQYKGFVVDISGAGNFIKVIGATMATCVLGDCDADVKKVAIKAGEIPSGADLENNKTATINVSTYIKPVGIYPTAGKDGMKKATVTLSNIPRGGSSTAYAWETDDSGNVDIVWADFATSPEDIGSYSNSLILAGEVSDYKILRLYVSNPLLSIDFTRDSDTSFKIVTDQNTTISWTRNSSLDFTLWSQ